METLEKIQDDSQDESQVLQDNCIRCSSTDFVDKFYNDDARPILIHLAKGERMSYQDYMSFRRCLEGKHLLLDLSSSELLLDDLETYYVLCSKQNPGEMISDFEDFVKRRSSMEGTIMSVITANMCLRIMEAILFGHKPRLKKRIINVSMEVDDKKEQPLLLNCHQRKTLTRLTALMKLLEDQDRLDMLVFNRKFLTTVDFPLEVLWWLEKERLLLFTKYVLAPSRDLGLVESSLFRLLCSMDGVVVDSVPEVVEIDLTLEMEVCEDHDSPQGPDIKSLVGSMVRDLVALLLVRGASVQQQSNQICGQVLENVSSQVINVLLSNEGTSKDNLPGDYFTPLRRVVYLRGGILTHFASAHIAKVFSMVPRVGVQDTISRHSTEWTYQRIPSHIADFLLSILKVLGDAAVNDIDNGILQSEVNWKWLLMTVSVYLRHFPQADKLLKDLVERHLHEAILKRNLSLLTAVFLLARHCCAAGTPLFPSYLAWFTASFGNDSITATSLANYQVLLKFLTGLVPAEPAFCLKVHINKSAEEDVSRVLAHYEETGEIIQLLFDAYLMRRSYFEKHFLPKLLTGRDIPDPPDARARFIEKLFLAGKIPRPAFQKYQKACAEASRYLEEV
uniref:Fanconi anemia group A protein n=1 Tax=Timema bartmani TaxID=61472 RepID=A0A7R9I6S4_9NEOP|nr:unnamed protein product [Timema bartmani]